MLHLEDLIGYSERDKGSSSGTDYQYIQNANFLVMLSLIFL